MPILDTSPLFTEDFRLVVSARHRLAGHDSIEFDDLRSEQLLSRAYCEHTSRLNASLRDALVNPEREAERRSLQLQLQPLTTSP